jgi:hypothetical protein
LKADDIFDILLVFIILVVGAASTFTSLAFIQTKITKSTMVDKSTIESFSGDAPDKFEITSQDVLLMYVVADQYQPYPAQMQINEGTTTKFNTSYFLDTSTAINNLWNSEINSIIGNSVKDFRIVYDADGGNVRWKVVVN